MAIKVPGRRPAFPPIGKLRASPIHGGHRSGMISLNLTPMVDMMTMLVVFLLQSFSADGEIMFVQKNMTPPGAEQAKPLIDRGPVVTVLDDSILVDGEEVVRLVDVDENEQVFKPVSDMLTGVRERQEKLKGRDVTKSFEGVVIVQADEETDFMLLRKAIASINVAGWAKINFSVKQIGGGGGGAEGGEGGEH